jgi:mannose-6-phosphate isomerase-like protein (cupin superfamily)
MRYKVSVEEALSELQKKDKAKFVEVMKHGSMVIEIFKPEIIDTQTPHKQDEIYVIINGNSTFFRKGERVTCSSGDIIFVPAGMEHRFENFSDDFETWVIFYGPEGGEKI